MSGLLSPDHVAALKRRAGDASDDLLQKRAQLLLLYHDGQPTSAVAREVGIAPSTARKWKQRYQSEGLSIFPDDGSAPPAGKAPASKKPRTTTKPRAPKQAAAPSAAAAPATSVNGTDASDGLSERVAKLFRAVGKTTGKKRRLKKLQKQPARKALKRLEAMLKKRRKKLGRRLQAKKRDLSKKKRKRLERLDKTLKKHQQTARSLRKRLS